MQRRQFVQSAVQGAAVSAVGLGKSSMLLAGDTSPNTDWDIGKHIYKSLKWNMVATAGSVLEKFRMLKRLGYDGVELDSPDGLEQDEAIGASQESGLRIEGIVNSTHWRIRHSDPDPSVRNQAMSNMRTAMRFANAVGADSVLLVPGKVADAEKENHDHVWKRSSQAIRELLPLAESLGIQILIENVGNGFCETPALFAEYVDQFDHPLVGIHFDIGNFIRLGPPADWIRFLGRRIKKLDVKDRTRANEPTLIGDGQADWPEVRQALADIDYQGWAAAEVKGGDEARLSDVLNRMNRVLGKSNGKPPSRA